ncbi:MAG: glycosyltransferase [Pseudomonadota bacterium]
MDAQPRKILICTYGTRGDVEPFLALAKGLRVAGCDVLLATSERFEEFALQHGVPFYPMSDESLAAIETPDGRAMMEGGAGLIRRMMAGIRLARRSGPISAELMRQVWSAARSFGPDAIIFHSKLFAASHVAEKLRIPAFLGALQPMIVPTSAFPAMGLPSLSLPRFNQLTYRLVNASFGALRKSVNRFRDQSLGMPPIKDVRSVLFPPGAGVIPVLHAHSPSVMARPQDWPPHAHVTGTWRLPSLEEFSPPQELVTFLEDGPPPVFVGFGSMTSTDGKALGRLVSGALRKAGQRGVVAQGWADLDVDGGADIIAIPPVPYSWLFPRMAAVVHHGGAGTTAEGFHAGVPCLICPFFGDQPGWGRLSADLGVGAQPIKRSRLTEERLAKGIAQITGSADLRANAKSLAEKLAREDGVQSAVDIVMRNWARRD